MNTRWLLMIAALVGCGGTREETHEATSDSGIDADAEPDSCVDPLTGIVAGLDGIPIAGARVAVSYDPVRFAVTDANGAFSLCLCVPTTYVVRLSLDAPGDYLDGEIYFENPWLVGQTIRTMTPAQAAELFDYNAARAQVIAQFAVDGTSLTMAATHDSEMTVSEPGAVTLYANVDATASPVQLEEGPSLDPQGWGTTTHDLDVAPGTITIAVLSAPLE